MDTTALSEEKISSWRQRLQNQKMNNGEIKYSPILSQLKEKSSYFYIKLEDESPQRNLFEDSDESMYGSVHSKETDICRDTSDTESNSSFTTDGIATVEIQEYEVATEISEEDLFSNDSSSGTDDILVAAFAAARAICDTSNYTSDFADTEESETDTKKSISRFDPELTKADLWTCIKCKNKQNNPMFRYCEKCYQIRKSHFPPRPRHRRSQIPKTDNRQQTNIISKFRKKSRKRLSSLSSSSSLLSVSTITSTSTLSLPSSSSSHKDLELTRRFNKLREEDEEKERKILGFSGEDKNIQENSRHCEISINLGKEFSKISNKSISVKKSYKRRKYDGCGKNFRKRRLFKEEIASSSKFNLINNPPDAANKKNTCSILETTEEEDGNDISTLYKSTQDLDSIINKMREDIDKIENLKNRTPVEGGNIGAVDTVNVKESSNLIRGLQLKNVLNRKRKLSTSSSSSTNIDHEIKNNYSKKLKITIENTQKDSGISSAASSQETQAGKLSLMSSPSSTSTRSKRSLSDENQLSPSLSLNGNRESTKSSKTTLANNHQIDNDDSVSDISEEIPCSRSGNNDKLLASEIVIEKFLDYNNVKIVNDGNSLIKNNSSPSRSNSFSVNNSYYSTAPPNVAVRVQKSLSDLTPTSSPNLNRLNKKSNSILGSNELESNYGSCMACLSAPKNGVFVHSNILHLCSCYKCAVKIWNKSKRCPICNCPARNVMKLFIN